MKNSALEKSENEEEVYDDEFDNNDDYDEYEDNESIAADDITGDEWHTTYQIIKNTN
jgi:RNA polymerase sigma-54 factor